MISGTKTCKRRMLATLRFRLGRHPCEGGSEKTMSVLESRAAAFEKVGRRVELCWLDAVGRCDAVGVPESRACLFECLVRAGSP